MSKPSSTSVLSSSTPWRFPWGPETAIERDRIVVGPFVDAHLLADEIGIGGGRSPRSTPRQGSIEIAASWPCATAVMMFLGPSAASPPKNTFGKLDGKVSGQASACRRRRNRADRARSRGTRSPGRPRPGLRHRRTPRRVRRSELAARRPLRVVSALRPFRTPSPSAGPPCRNALGTRKLRILTPSCSASSFSHGEAFISVKPERTMTLTSSPPRRRACGSNPSLCCRRRAR